MATHSADVPAHFTAVMGVVAEVPALRSRVQQLQATVQQQQITVQQQQTTVQLQQVELRLQQRRIQLLETGNGESMEGDIGWAHHSYTWEVTGYTVPRCMFSPVFSVAGFDFKLDLDSAQPDEDCNDCDSDSNSDSNDCTGMYLWMTKGWKVLVKFELQIISAHDSSVSVSSSGEHTYEGLEGYGSTKMFSNETMKTYLKDGKVTVRARVSVKLPEDLASAPLLTKH
jgi:hypothetical protein